MSKGERYGKYLGKKGWATPHHLYPKDWGVQRYFEGSDLKTYTFRNPENGIVWHIHAPDEATARAQADVRGWVQYRKNNRTSKSKKSKRK